MAAKDTIEHDGIVIKVENNAIIVQIQNQSACASCHSKGACGLSEVAQKNITAEKPNVPVAVGDKVIVTASTRNAMLSVAFAYIIPSALIIVLLALLITAGTSEVLAAAIVLLAVAVYFVILYLCRNSFTRKIKFKVKIA